jgi:hypothetical protein
MRFEPPRVSAPRTLLAAVAIFVLAGLALGAWSLAGPAGSTPDEEFHMASIWCGQGTDADHCRSGSANGRRLVPADVILGNQCYATARKVSAACLSTGYGSDPTPNFDTDRGNFRGDYPPVYYAVMHTFVGDDLNTSVLTMRAVNVLLFLAITGAVMALVPPTLRRATAWSFLLTSVPMGVWLISSINPSGWAIMSAGTLWPCLYALPDAVGSRRIALAALAALTALMGVGARTDSCLFTLMAIALVFILRRREILRSRLALVTGTLIAVAAVFFFLEARQSVTVLDAFGTAQDTSALSAKALLWSNIQNLPSIWTGVWGTWPLGWIDTRLPPAVLFGSLLPWAALMFTSLRDNSGRQIVAVLLLASALVTYPLYLVTRSHLPIGEGVQPRYIVPLMVMLTGMALVTTRSRTYVPARGQLVLVTSALGTANALALHTNIRRYVTGTDVVSFNLDRGREWWWNLPLTPMTVWAAGSLAFVAATWLALTAFSPASDTIADDAEAAAPVDGGAHRAPAGADANPERRSDPATGSLFDGGFA